MLPAFFVTEKKIKKQLVTNQKVKKLMERCSSRIDYLFSKTNPKVRERLKLDDTAMYSVTDEITADEITALMVERIGNNKSLAIVDATACVTSTEYCLGPG